MIERYFPRTASPLLLALWALPVLVILLTGHLYILPYSAVLGAILVGLSCVPVYRIHPARRTYDLLFLAYLWAVVLIRCRPFRWSAPVELALNIAEHIGFALVIGLMFYQTLLHLLHLPPQKAVLTGLVCFNVLGFGIELYQDAWAGDVLQGFDADAWKDIAMNIIGSLILFAILRRTTRTEQAPTPM
ncbi:MAG TPA: hypothetical protein PLR96_06195 [Flavobacteriales bacterium]|jgi:hypothetical protein|nr:hypothetical protein [Flavobacteriales bacterium]